jgi:hypothetical protein
MKKIIFSLLACSFFVSQHLAAADFAGEYSFQSPAGAIHLSLEQNARGQVSGLMSDGVSSFRLQGQTEGEIASGYVKAEYPPDFGFSAQFGQSGSQLLMQIYPFDATGGAVVAMVQNMTFVRSAGSASTPGVASEKPRDESLNNSADSNVIVNGKALTRGQVASFELQYQTRLIDGRFWYDDKCGAWGIEGGPAVGFIHPSLPLPGPMPANASGGGTGIFINGREIHPIDRQVLIGMFGTAIPGRYWLDGYGNLGVEGGGFLVNLAAAAQQLQQRTTQTGSGTVSSGPAGAMFSGTNLSTGKPTFWYAGM